MNFYILQSIKHIVPFFLHALSTIHYNAYTSCINIAYICIPIYIFIVHLLDRVVWEITTCIHKMRYKINILILQHKLHCTIVLIKHSIDKSILMQNNKFITKTSTKTMLTNRVSNVIKMCKSIYTYNIIISLLDIKRSNLKLKCHISI